MNTTINKSIRLNTDHLNINFPTLDKINKEDISKIYIMESRDANGIHYEIASTENPIWTCVKHFFISLFTLFKYKYESGQSAINKINHNPTLLKTLNDKMTKAALPVLVEESPKGNQNSITSSLIGEISKQMMINLCGIFGLAIARHLICSKAITESFSWQNLLLGAVVINCGSYVGNALLGARGAEMGNLFGQSVILGTESVFANSIGYAAGKNIGEIAIGLLPQKTFTHIGETIIGFLPQN